jgi:hypothetical protein
MSKASPRTALPFPRARKQAALAGAFAVVIGLVILLACTPTEYLYAPVRTTSAEIVDTAATMHFVPPDDPRGDLRIGILGIEDIRRIGRRGKTDFVHVVRVRMTVANRSNERWILHGSEQRILAGRVELRATSETFDADPMLDVPPGRTAALDLLFALPMSLETRELGAFDLAWAIHLGSRVHTERTAFERFLTDGRAVPTLPRSEDAWHPR